MSEPEFQVGDTVHYRSEPDQPEAGYPVQVISISHGMCGNGCHLNGEPDPRIFYYMRGDGYRNPDKRTGHWSVVTDATGRCILESSLYQQPQ